jgi:CRISPR/Cas system-associated protein Cas10 (large subunit of type III CRISPR-Cas system)
MSTIVFNGELALEQFNKRKLANKNVEKIDNASLRAGSPMTYYCKHCDVKVATLPEGHWEPAPDTCAACKALVTHGLL